MDKLKEKLNYGFEIYNQDGSLLDKIKHPGDPGFWLCTPDGPDLVAFFSISYYRMQELLKEIKTFPMVRFEIDKNKIEIDNTREEFSLCVLNSISDAFEIAQKIGVDYFYFSEWDYERITIILNTDGSRTPYKTKDFLYYTNDY